MRNKVTWPSDVSSWSRSITHFISLDTGDRHFTNLYGTLKCFWFFFFNSKFVWSDETEHSHYKTQASYVRLVPVQMVSDVNICRVAGTLTSTGSCYLAPKSPRWWRIWERDKWGHMNLRRGWDLRKQASEMSSEELSGSIPFPSRAARALRSWQKKWRHRILNCRLYLRKSTQIPPYRYCDVEVFVIHMVATVTDTHAFVQPEDSQRVASPML